MKSMRALVTTPLVAVAALSLAGCAVLPKLAWFSRPDKTPEIRAVATTLEAQGPSLSLADRLYPIAAAELRARRYGRAIEVLHAAREGAPNDVRILNALGVAYDKLGRFDLSARYYELALRVDPISPVVQANMRYSARLQGEGAALANAPAQPPATASAPEIPAALAVHTAAIRLAEGSATVRTQALLTGSSLVIVDGSGRNGAAARVRGALLARGWSVASHVQKDALRATSQISFPAPQQAAAEALARTLPFPTQLSACVDACAGLKLTIGADFQWI